MSPASDGVNVVILIGSNTAKQSSPDRHRCLAAMESKADRATSARVRTVQGSCWPCRKRRIKCDLIKPTCSRCSMVGATCSYASRQIRWSTRPVSTAPIAYQIRTREEQLASSLPSSEKRALEYFAGRIWPLMTTESTPCTPPTLVALESRVVLLAACVIADTHRVLQDGRNSASLLAAKRGQCLATVRSELRHWCGGSVSVDAKSLPALLMAVILLYLGDGFFDNPALWISSTASHRDGLRAIIGRLGSLDTIFMRSMYPEPLQMLVTQFASGDLTTALLHGGKPSMDPSFWDKLGGGPVWWTRDPECPYSLAAVLGQMSRMAFYLDSVTQGLECASMEKACHFEVALYSAYGPAPTHPPRTSASILIHCFHYTALIYLYRAVYGLPMSNFLVQKCVQSCLDEIISVSETAKVLHCLIFPLFIAGTHTRSAPYRQKVLRAVDSIYRDMRFTSVRAVRDHLSAVWGGDVEDTTWFDMFHGLGSNVVVL